MKIRPIFAWYDLWVGAFWDGNKRRLYILPLPCMGIVIELKGIGRMSVLEPCPFCGGRAEIVHIEDGENAGGSCVCCTQCMASGNVEFEFKENFVSNWNRRTPPKGHGHD